jgi:WD40 repeat protein|eukprot:g3049.t1
MELLRHEIFTTGNSGDEESQKETADDRLQRLVQTSVPKDKAVTLNCHVSLVGKRAIFGGRSDGVVVHWKPSSARNRESFDLKESHLVGHKGSVQCITFAPYFASRGLLLTGSTDRTVRAWDPWTGIKANQCVQTLTAHGSTINAINHAEGLLFTCANDHTFLIWRPAVGRDLLLFPFFEVVQTIRMPGESCFTQISLKSGEGLSAYLVDNTGGLSFYNQTDYASSTKELFELDKHRSRQVVHRLGVTHVLIVQSQNFVITLSYDNSMRVFDAMTGSPFLSVDNPHRCRYTGLDWNETEQELFLVDASGYLHVWNIYMEKCLKQQKIFNGALTSISVVGKTDTIFITGKNRLERWKISREMKFEEYQGHVGPVVSIKSVGLTHHEENKGSKQGKMDEGKQSSMEEMMAHGEYDNEAAEKHAHAKRQSTSRIYSASIDNTIRAWDPYDMSCIFTLTESRSEISCMLYLQDSNVIVTGNEDGSVRWWNPSSGSTVALREHKNTVSCMCFAPLRRVDYLITGGYDGKVGIWDVTKRRSVKPRLENLFQAHTGVKYESGIMAGSVLDAEILCVVYNGQADDPTKRTFFTGGSDPIIRIWNILSQSLEGQLEGHSDAVTCMALDANFLFSGSDDNTIRMWNISHVKEGYELAVFENAHSKSVQDLLILDDIGYLASCSFDGLIKVWNYAYDEETGKTGKMVQQFEHPDQFRCLEYQRTTSHILGGTEQGGVLSFSLDPSLLPEDHRMYVPKDSSKEAIAEAHLEEQALELELEFENGSESEAEEGDNSTKK